MTMPAKTNFGTKTNFYSYGTFLSACVSITERSGTDTELYLLFSAFLEHELAGIRYAFRAGTRGTLGG